MTVGEGLAPPAHPPAKQTCRKGLDLPLRCNDTLFLKNGRHVRQKGDIMRFIRAIMRLCCGGGRLMRYHERVQRVREVNLTGLRSGFLIFSEKGY